MLAPSLRLIEAVYCVDQSVRALITADATDVYRIYPECWDTSEFEIARYAYWSPRGSRTSVTDSLETGRAIAREFIAEIKGTSEP